MLAANVLSMTNDRESLERIIDQVSDTLGRPTTLLADAVYAGEAVVDALEQHGIEPLIFITLQIEPRTYDFRPPKMPDKDKTPPRITAPWRLAFMEKLQTAQAKHKYPKLKPTVEPAFGIIKSIVILIPTAEIIDLCEPLVSYRLI